jgi:putative oxidoreductase
MASTKFVSMGFPGFLGGPIGVIEVIGGVLLLLGIWFKWTNWTLAGIIVVAALGVHVPGSWHASVEAGKLILTAGLERDVALASMFWILSAYGPGKFVFAKSK